MSNISSEEFLSCSSSDSHGSDSNSPTNVHAPLSHLSSSNQLKKHDLETFKNSISLDGFQPLKKCPTLLTLEELNSSDYEIWTFTVPGTVDSVDLKNLKFSLSKTTRLKIEEEEYETMVQESVDKLLFLVPDSNGTMNITEREIAGSISIVKENSVPKVNKDSFTKAKKITKTPNGLKRRHPIYGKDSNGVDQKTQNSQIIKPKLTDVQTEKKKKKKKLNV